MKRKKPIQFSRKELIEGWNELQKNKDLKGSNRLRVFSKQETQMMTWLLFRKPPEFRVWIIKKCDIRAVRELINRRESQRQGIPLRQSSLCFRRIKFLKELINCRFNAAEAARRCGYSWKYAKQAAYRIRRKLY